MKKISIFTFLFIFSLLSKAQDIDSNLVYEKFELNPYRAIIDTTSQDSVWQIGQPQKLNGFSMAYSGVKAIITDTINSYPINHTSCFYFRFDSLPNYWAGWCKDMQLHFYHKLQCDSLTEGGYIEISYDSGLTFHNIVDDDDLYGNTLNYQQTESDLFYSKQDTLNNGTPAFTGNWTDWKKSSYYWYGLMPVKSLQNFALIRFCFQSDSTETNKNGWMIDDVKLTLYGNLPKNCTSVENYSKKQLNMIPNPVSENITFIDLPLETQIWEYKIFDIHSREVQSGIFNSNQIPVQQLQTGVYFIRLIKDEKPFGTGKFIKLSGD